MMTQEEKAKAYDEALKDMKVIYPNLKGDAKLAVEHAFPELKEAEDERIGNLLYCIVRDREDVRATLEANGVSADKALDYLEKQKEASKAIEAVERIDKYIDEHTANAHDMKDSNPDKKYYSGVDDTLSDIAGILIDVYSDDNINRGKEQKEQKPVDSSDDELERHQKELHDFKVFATKQAKEHRISISFVHDFEWNNFCAELLSYFNEQKSAEWSEDNKLHLNNAILAAEKEWGNDSRTSRWLKLLPERFNLQPKQEWSDEDENIYKVVLELLNSWSNGTIGGCIIPPNTDRYINWFKSLPERFNLQPKEEWMEEDKKFIDKLCNLFPAIAKNNYVGGYYAPDLINRLKSLRPQSHWKPSKEQMEALNNAQGELCGTEYNECLCSLIDDLEKL